MTFPIQSVHEQFVFQSFRVHFQCGLAHIVRQVARRARDPLFGSSIDDHTGLSRCFHAWDKGQTPVDWSVCVDAHHFVYQVNGCFESTSTQSNARIVEEYVTVLCSVKDLFCQTFHKFGIGYVQYFSYDHLVINNRLTLDDLLGQTQLISIHLEVNRREKGLNIVRGKGWSKRGWVSRVEGSKRDDSFLVYNAIPSEDLHQS